jgi:hypothetical protein
VALAKDRIQVKFDGALDEFEEDDFKVWKDNDGDGFLSDGDDQYTVDDIEVKSSTKIILVIDDDKKIPATTEGGAGAKKILLGTAKTTQSVTTSGSNLINGIGYTASADGGSGTAGYEIHDEIAPSVKKLDNVNKNAYFTGEEKNGSSGNTSDGVYSVWAVNSVTGDLSVVYILFDEPLDDDGSGNLNTNNFIVKAGGDRLQVDSAKQVTSGLVQLILSQGPFGATDAKVMRGDSVDIAIVYDVTPISNNHNYKTNISMTINYSVPEIDFAADADYTGGNLNTINIPEYGVYKGAFKAIFE